MTMRTIRTDQRTLIAQRVEFRRRAVIERVPGLYVRRIWESRCGRYRVTEFRYAVDRATSYTAERSYAICPGRCGWDLISRHVKRARAEAACRKDAERCAREKSA